MQAEELGLTFDIEVHAHPFHDFARPRLHNVSPWHQPAAMLNTQENVLKDR
jgi:hypothetical protein